MGATQGMVSIEKIVCPISKEEVLIIGYGGVSGMWAWEGSHSEVKCPYMCRYDFNAYPSCIKKNKIKVGTQKVHPTCIYV